MTATVSRPDVYATITNKILAKMEQGELPWCKPWNAQHAAGSTTRPLRYNGECYHGVNVLILWLTAEERSYHCPLWITFNQAKELGGFVKKGEKGTPVVYANTFTKKETDEATGEESEEKIPFLKSYTVFNALQVEGLPEHYYAMKEQPKNLAERLGDVEAFVAHTKAEIRHGGNKAFYLPSTDYVQMPPYECFRDREFYYSTLSHELTHWSGSDKRLKRELNKSRFGDETYAVEELIAELGAAFLCADFGIATEPRADHAAYLQNWLKVLKNDKKAIFTAAALAEKAVAYLHGLQPK
ncbi:MAG: zincin-like metallopeptidase domain-containing protein [Gemmatales bacterium]